MQALGEFSHQWKKSLCLVAGNAKRKTGQARELLPKVGYNKLDCSKLEGQHEMVMTQAVLSRGMALACSLATLLSNYDTPESCCEG